MQLTEIPPLRELQFGSEGEFFAAHGVEDGERRVAEFGSVRVVGTFSPSGLPRTIEVRGDGATRYFRYSKYEVAQCSSGMFQPPEGARFSLPAMK
jgi:hypothetical protein